MDYMKIAVLSAKKSSCKHKMGAVLVSSKHKLYASGFNIDVPYDPLSGHAVMVALEEWKSIALDDDSPTHLYVSSEPCKHCIAYINRAGIPLENITIQPYGIPKETPIIDLKKKVQELVQMSDHGIVALIADKDQLYTYNEKYTPSIDKAIAEARSYFDPAIPHIIYLSQKPSDHIVDSIIDYGILEENIIIVEDATTNEEFIKDDEGKNSWELLPESIQTMFPQLPESIKLYLDCQQAYVKHDASFSRKLKTLSDRLLNINYSDQEYHAINDIVQVLATGATKYIDNNSRNTPSLGRYVSALGRHIYADCCGEVQVDDSDNDTGITHVAVALTNILLLLDLLETKQ